jgi:hypothetical protein
MSITTARYWREIPQRYRFEAGKCKDCGEVSFPPRRVCPACGSRKFRTVVLPDHGTVLTFTVIRVAPEEYTDSAPYAVGIVKLADGTKVMMQIVDADLDKLAIGLSVKIEFRKLRGEGEAGVLFYGYKAVPA